MARGLSGLIFGGAVLLVAAPALAQQPLSQQDSQNAGQGMFARDRNISVSQRPHPGFDPVPVPLGGFLALPKLDAGVEYNDNIYAENTGAKSDTIFTVNPELDIQSNWNRNYLSAFVRSATRDYSKYSSETTTDYQLGAQGMLQAGDGKFSAGGDTGELTEPRTSPSTSHGTTHPVRYQQTDGFFSGVEELNRVRLTGRVDIGNDDYHNGVDPSGHSVLEDDRDHTDYTYSGKAEYALSPDTAVYMYGAYNDHQYRLQPPVVPTNRDSHGEVVSGGANFDITREIRGDIQVGWMQQQFAASNLRTYSGLSALGSVEWFPTELTTVTLTGSRQVADASAPGAAIYVASGVGLQLDHELLRNLILTGRVGYEDDAYQGVSRDDHTTNAYIGGRYMLNRLVGLTVGYTYVKNDSTGAARGPLYNVNRIMASLNVHF
jgi:hypothetical protein